MRQTPRLSIRQRLKPKREKYVERGNTTNSAPHRHSNQSGERKSMNKSYKLIFTSGIGLLVILLFVIDTLGQTTPFVKKDTVIPKFGFALAQFDEYKKWQGNNQFIIEVGMAEGKVTIFGYKNWDSKSLPELHEYIIREIKVSKGKPTDVYILSKDTFRDMETKYGKFAVERQIKLSIAAELRFDEVLSAILFKGTSDEFLKSSYVQSIIGRFVQTIFTGSLAKIPIDAQRRLLVWSRLQSDAFRETKFKDKIYLGVDTTQDVVYNTIQLNQAERASRQVSFALKKLKDIFDITGGIEGIDGLSATGTIGSYNFVRKDDRTDERFEMHVTFDILKRYANAEITNQELVDASLILVDGSRIKVNLTSFS